MELPELTYSSSLFDTLRLLSKEHYFVNYPSSGSKRTPEEICEKSLELIDSLNAYGFELKETASSYSATLQLAIVSVDYPYVDSALSVTDAADAKVPRKRKMKLPWTLQPPSSGNAPSIMTPATGSICGLMIKAARRLPAPCLPSRSTCLHPPAISPN